ncbi:MAG TPA: BTAD domain-containing putative transcriptional regulator [Pyrinomonadaceae bacterium]|jgi:DNA-binding SARP family transcriptional activator/Tol biopolymer transport system component
MQPEQHSPTSLEIYLLGKFQVKVNGLLVKEHFWQRRSAKLLVKLLALTPHHELHREKIIDILWTDQDIETAKNSLHKTIYMARRAFEPFLEKATESQFIQTKKQHVILFSPGSLFIDVEEFERLANIALKTEDIETGESAIALYKDDLLTETLFEEWLVVKRESLRILYRKLTTKIAELQASKAEFGRSIELLKKLITDDPTDEHVHQHLMRYYAQTGSKYQALKQYEQCCQALREMSVEPEQETVELKEQIQQGKIAPLKLITNIDSRQTAISSNGHIQAEKRIVKPPPSVPKVKQLTFRQGVIQSAKFSSDNQTIIYDAAWGGVDPELFTIPRDGWDSQPVGLKQTNIFSVSPTGEMAIALRRKFLRGYVSSATLARIHQRGGMPRELLESVQWADWYPDKECLAKLSDNQCLVIVRESEGRSRLEYPIGNVLYETGGWISHPSFSPSGEAIAFIDHPTLAEDSGAVAVINLKTEDKSEKRIISDGWISIRGLVWNKATGEIWFTAAREGNARSVYAVSVNDENDKETDNERLVYKGIGSLTIHDLSPDGAALITVDKTRIRISSGNCTEEKEEHDLSWHDWSLVRDLSPDGETILFTEAGESGGSLYGVYVRKTNGSPALRLGNGSALALSPNGKYALVRLLTTKQQVALLPTGAGETKMLPPFESKSLKYQPWACWFPNGKKILFAANEADKGTKLYTQEWDSEPICITPKQEGVEISSPHSISPDGKQIAIINSENRICLYEIENGKCKLLPDLRVDYLVVRWSGDGKYLFVRERGKVPAVIYRYEIETARTEEWIRLMPQDKTGVHEILRILLTPDGKSYVYSFTRDLSDLFLIEGLQ